MDVHVGEVCQVLGKKSEVLHRFFSDLFTGYKQWKLPAYLLWGHALHLPIPHPPPLVSRMWWGMVATSSQSLPKYQQGYICKVKKGLKLKPATYWLLSKQPQHFSPHHLAEGVLCRASHAKDRSKWQSKRCLKYPSLLSEQTHSFHWREREKDNCARNPQAPSPSEQVNSAFKPRLPPASSLPDVARHRSLMRLTCIFNVVIFWLWQLYRHRDYKRVTSMQWAANEPHVKKPLCHRDKDIANKHFWGTLSP